MSAENNHLDSPENTGQEQNLILQQAMMELTYSAPNRMLSRLVGSLVGVDRDNPITSEMWIDRVRRASYPQRPISAESARQYLSKYSRQLHAVLENAGIALRMIRQEDDGRKRSYFPAITGSSDSSFSRPVATAARPEGSVDIFDITITGLAPSARRVLRAISEATPLHPISRVEWAQEVFARQLMEGKLDIRTAVQRLSEVYRKPIIVAKLAGIEIVKIRSKKPENGRRYARFYPRLKDSPEQTLEPKPAPVKVSIKPEMPPRTASVPFGQFGLVELGREYDIDFYCAYHRVFDSATVTIPTTYTNPQTLITSLDSKISTRTCLPGCPKQVLKVYPSSAAEQQQS